LEVSEQRQRETFIDSAILRRNLNAFQKIELAQTASARERSKAQERQKRGKKDTLLSTVQALIIAAFTAGVDVVFALLLVPHFGLVGAAVTKRSRCDPGVNLDYLHWKVID
jgi:hypothetical protein